MDNKFAGRKPNILFMVLMLTVTIVLILCACEAMLQIRYNLTFGKWYFNNINTNCIMFKAHPYLIVAGKPSVSITHKGKTISHNSLGFRGKEVALSKKEGVRRIITIGGSTTYCTGIDDVQTWPYYMEKELGDHYEVINLGFPCYGTVEHIIQTALLISDLSPDVCIYYIGWNDIRNMHIKDLKPDYSNFHGVTQVEKMAICHTLFKGRSILINKIKRIADKCALSDRCTNKPSRNNDSLLIDERALGLYVRNVKLLIALCKAQHVIPIIVPQILNYDKLTSDSSYDEWCPFVKDKDLKYVMDVYNNRIREVCRSENVDFIDNVLNATYDQSCFIDIGGHFSPIGNEKFAHIIVDYLLTKELGVRLFAE